MGSAAAYSHIADKWPEVTILYPDEGAEWVEKYDLCVAKKLLNSLEFRVNVLTLSEWAAKNRHLPAGTPFEGPWQNAKTRYMQEIMDNLSPSSPVEVTALMKPVQSGGTAGTAENKIGYSIDVDPCPILYVTATQDLCNEFGAKRLNPLLELCGLRDKLKDQHQSKGTKATGDKLTSKMFPGGNILICSYNQAALLRMMSFQVVIFDEVDTAPASVNCEGNPLKIAYARTTAYEGRKKILILSTPVAMGTSEIHKAFLEGDQRYYWIPCPHCGQMLTMRLLDDDYNCNLKYEFSNDAQTIVDPNSVYYPCPDSDCGGKIRNFHKTKIYQEDLGEWVPTNPDAKPNYRSYWFDALLCPPGMTSFATLAQEFVDAVGDTEAMRAYVTLKGATPFKEQINVATSDDMSSKVSGYDRGTIPEWMGLVTVGGDVHKDRLDIEILGFNGNETFSIDWLHIHGPPEYKEHGSLWKFAKMFNNKELPGEPSIAFIDTRFGYDEVARCAANNEGIHAILGEKILPNRGPFRVTTLKKFDGMEAISVNTGLMKERTANSLTKIPLSDGSFPEGYLHFPLGYEEMYYKQLNSEAKSPVYNRKTGVMEGYIWTPIHNHGSHALDCHAYALAAEEYAVYMKGVVLGITVGYRDIVWKCIREPEKAYEVAKKLKAC